MLSPEIEEGNIEYKRYLLNLSLARKEELATQMKWRLGEGNGTAFYYLGVEDDGSIYQLTKEQSKESIENIKIIIKKINAKLESIKIKKQSKKKYYICKIIYEKNKVFVEKRILLLGNTGTGKTTFLSYLIHNKFDENSNLFILNHKHEIVSRKSSSFNYQYYISDDTRYIFLDTPGDNQYCKTLNRILLSFDIDLIIYFPDEWDKKELYYNYAKLKNIPWFEINLDLLLKQDDYLKMFESKMIKKDIIVNKNIKYIVLQTYPHQDLGWIVSGYLQSGELKVGDDLTWYFSTSKSYFNSDINKKVKVKIQSIHINKLPINQVKGPVTCTICLSNISKERLKYGFISNNVYYPKRSIEINWIIKNKEFEELTGQIENCTVTIKKIGVNEKLNRNIYLISNINFNLQNKVFICSNGENNYLGVIN